MLQVVTATSPGWVAWLGRCGHTRQRGRHDIADQVRPRGPCRHAPWSDPASLLGAAEAAADQPPRPLPPMPPLPKHVAVGRTDDGMARVSYELPDLAPGQPPAAKLVVTVNSGDDHLSPISYASTLDATGAV